MVNVIILLHSVIWIDIDIITLINIEEYYVD